MDQLVGIRETNVGGKSTSTVCVYAIDSHCYRFSQFLPPSKVTKRVFLWASFLRLYQMCQRRTNLQVDILAYEKEAQV